MNSYFKVIIYASFFSVLIPLTMYLANLRRLTKPVHIIGMLVVVSGLCDIVAFLLVKQKMSTAVLTSIFFMGQFCLLSYYYYITAFRNKYEVITGISVIQFFLAFAIATVSYEDLNAHQNFTWFSTSVILIIYGVYFFRKIQKEYKRSHTVGHSWINCGVLFYLIASLWIFALTSDAMEAKLGTETSQLIWRFHDINNVMKNILLAIGIYYSVKNVAAEGAESGQKAV